MVGYVLTKLTRPITRLLERDLRRREEKGKVGEVNKRWVWLVHVLRVEVEEVVVV